MTDDVELGERHRAQLNLTMAVRIFSAVVLAWLFASTAMAAGPGSEFHVLGVVTAIDAKHIEVKAAKGPPVSVTLTKQVQFKNKSNPKSNDPPSVGDRVIIEVTKDNKKVIANVVHYSAVTHTTHQRQQ